MLTMEIMNKMGNRNDNSTAYVHVDEPNLLNLARAMDYNADGEPTIRVQLGTDQISITGPVTVTNEVEITNDDGAPVPVSGTVALDVASLAALENISIDNFPVIQTVDGTVALDTASLAALENISIDNFPVIQTVDGTVALDTASLAALENISIDNFPVIQTVDGTVALDAASLAALENITVATILDDVNVTQGTTPWTVDGTVALDTASLAALENITVATILDDVNVTQGTTPWTVDGTVNIGTMPNVTINDPIDVNATIVSSTVGSNKPFYLEVAQDLVPGYSSNHKFGAVPSMSNNTIGSIWDIDDTLYPFDALGVAGSIVNVERNSAADAGSVIRVQGLDVNYDFIEEDFTLTAAETLGTAVFRRINRAFIVTDGGTNIGDIDIEVGGPGGATVARITAGAGQTLMAVYTVPANVTAYVLNVGATASDDADATISLLRREVTSDVFRIATTFELQQRGGGFTQEFQIPIKLLEKTDIDLRVISRASGKRFTSTFDILLVGN